MADDKPIASREALASWFHQEFGQLVQCEHVLTVTGIPIVPTCEAWADQILLTGPVQTPAQFAAGLAEVVRAGRDAYLDSPNLDRAWIAGWHAATDHHAAALAGEA